MSHELERMVATQARHISRLNEEIREKNKFIENLNSRLRVAKKSAEYYDKIQKACLENDAVMSSFQSFMAVLTLATSEKVEGLTAPEIDRIDYSFGLSPYYYDPRDDI